MPTIKMSFEFDTQKDAKGFSEALEARGWERGKKGCQDRIKNGVYVDVTYTGDEEDAETVTYRLKTLTADFREIIETDSHK